MEYNQIIIKKAYLHDEKEFEDYIKGNINEVSSLVIVKNYLNSIELSKIIIKNTKNFLSLTKLNLTANDLTSIPIEIKELKCLQHLNFNNNKIEKIENLDIESLKHIELRSNRIIRFENLNNLKNLEYLTLSCNLIQDIFEDDLGDWDKLTELGLFGNYISNPNIIILLGNKIKNLESIYIGGNLIKYEEKSIKDNFHKIRKIDGVYII